MGRYSVLRYKTKRYTRDLDQILHDDLSSDKAIQNLKVQEIDETRPGLGQFYCIPCAKYFETEHAKTHHMRGKVHKRRLKDIKFGPYTKEEADAASGLDVAKYLRKVELQKAIKAEAVVDELLTMPKREVQAESLEEIDKELEGMVEDKVEEDEFNSEDFDSEDLEADVVVEKTTV